MATRTRRLARLALLALAGAAAIGCGSSRTKAHDGVEVTLLSIARMDSLKAGMDSVQPANPDDELAVVQMQFNGAGRNSIKLPAAECVLTDGSGVAHQLDTDWEFSFGTGERVMVWDFIFSVPKTATLQSVRVGAITFDLGGVRDLDPDTRLTPGTHPRQTR